VETVAFYCVCDARHFLGLVALVNSLRLLGHGETVFVLDCGLSSWQLEVLGRDAAVVVVDAPSSWHPMLLKAALPLSRPAELMVVVDVDVIFTGRLDALIDAVASSGKPMFFPDIAYGSRLEADWELLGFGPPVPHAYLASGQFLLPAEAGARFLGLWAQALERLATDPALNAYGSTPEDNPFFFPDMDVLNALIGPAVPIDSFILADMTTAAYYGFEGMRLVDADRLVVEARDGSRPLLLHHFGEKPWNRLLAPTVYSQLMTRLLLGEDVALRTPPEQVPYWLRPGATVDRYVRTRLWLRRNLRGKLGIRPMLARQLGGLREAARRA
jgi:hypothetical protein